MEIHRENKENKIVKRKWIICSQLSMVAQTNEEIPHGTVMTFAEKHPFIVENRKLIPTIYFHSFCHNFHWLG